MLNTRSNTAPKRQITIQEACLMSNKQRQNKKARIEQRFKEGWVAVDPDNGSWVVKPIDTPTAGARLVNVKQNSTISDVFFQVLPPAVLVEVRKDVGREKLLFTGKPVPINEIYKLYA